jgi:hypothetical protein
MFPSILRFILESVQGSGLRKFAKDYHATQGFCLCHFLARLKDRTFGHFVSYFVKAQIVKEFELLRKAYCPQVHEAIRRIPLTGLKRAQAEFAKAGLGIIFRPGKQTPSIWIINQERWEQVSNIYKLQDCLPTTTNCLESINGHHNENTPRRNEFWASVFRLSMMVDHGIAAFSASVRHIFNSAIRRAVMFMLTIGTSEMTAQKAHYHTNAETRTCDCGISAYFTRMYRTFVPCCHLLSAGVEKPQMTEPPVLQCSDNPVDFESELHVSRY